MSPRDPCPLCDSTDVAHNLCSNCGAGNTGTIRKPTWTVPKRIGRKTKIRRMAHEYRRFAKLYKAHQLTKDCV